MTGLARAVVGTVTAAVAVGGAAVALAAGGGDETALGPDVATVVLGIHNSRFSTDAITVLAGTEVTFVVRNDDPINHELIVGDEDVHRRHETGTEPHHEARPGEVSVGPDAVAETTYLFDEPGTVVYACHLPGHVAYGMVGEVTVVE